MQIAEEKITRIVLCPDGLERTLTFPRWYWQNCDWLCENGYTNFDEMVVNVWNLTLKHRGDVENEFRGAVQWYIYTRMRGLFPEIAMDANDNSLEYLVNDKES